MQPLPQADSLTEAAYEIFANSAHDMEAKGGKCQLALRVYKMPGNANQVGIAWAYQAPTAQDLSNLRAALAEVISKIQPSAAQ